jgi:hypothetical protein
MKALYEMNADVGRIGLEKPTAGSTGQMKGAYDLLLPCLLIEEFYRLPGLFYEYGNTL